MRLIDSSGVIVDTDLLFGPNGTFTPPATQRVVKQYTSQVITHSHLSAGTTCTVALTGEPSAWIPLALVATTTVTTTSGNAETTGLSVAVGTIALADGYLNSTDIFGAASIKDGSPGAFVAGGYRAGDALIATFTASGGTESCSHITAMALTITVFYIEV